MFEKRTFQTIFMILVVILLILPAITTFNDFLTSFALRLRIFRWIQEILVPPQAKMITVILRTVGLPALPTSIGISLGGYQTLGANVTISWNCIGWQSFLLFLITLSTGLQGPYKLYTKGQTILIGFLGTFLMNILRITLVVLVAYYLGKTAGTIFHDYFSTIMTIAWLFFFWWFAYSFVLEDKDDRINPMINSRRLTSFRRF